MFPNIEDWCGADCWRNDPCLSSELKHLGCVFIQSASQEPAFTGEASSCTSYETAASDWAAGRTTWGGGVQLRMENMRHETGLLHVPWGHDVLLGHFLTCFFIPSGCDGEI